jgi:hypothetical protein
MSLSTFFVNLKKAAFDRETLTIGGGEFNAKEIHTLLQNEKVKTKYMKELLEAAIARVEIANKEGNPILSAWLPDAKSIVNH